ncbi:hypothetical protein SAMN05421788_11149 [Filimonas lacunae]|uniref:Polyketide cyclase / dehydrase and lipid transport n=1 Tax=Filimonas lacunae TaxID=477680 RepID=A0A173MB72_9BACT|nr:polyketide cyclase [Filimonas lacunae]BAV04749.1 hypothetical protein FLA_0748 [Filimonas lacunae]SIT32185.1 hypothetical protein SAMN05421788_11149 [Filimonas lacunae]
MRKILQDRSFRLSILLTLIFFGTGITFLLLGLADYSWILFVLLPVVLGISIGALPDHKWAMRGAVLAAVIALFFLLAAGLSGFVCVLMTLPFIIPLMFLGSVLTHLANRYKELKNVDNLPVLLLPLIPFLIAAPAEHMVKKDKEEVVSVQTVQVFAYTPEQVYETIKSVDTLQGEKPWLMYLDLPVPYKCVLEKEEVGGRRTCYFTGGNLSRGDFGGGTIEEKIVELQKAKVLRMDVTEYNLIGRKWLGFREAAYYFDAVGPDSCKLTRITTYTSQLTPRVYWEPLEKLGIRQEHDYVFANLASDLLHRYGKKPGIGE